MSTPTTVQVKIQLRRDTSANWASVNPVLLAGEMGLETNTNRIKVGNGSTAWNSLGYFPFVISGGTVTGNLEIGTTGTLTFEGSSADNFETTLGVINPTADRTINLPNVSGTIITTGDTGTVTSTMIADGTIVNADVSASAAIAHSKLATITAGYVLIGNASGVPTATQVTGDVTISDAGVTAISSGVIVDADVAANAEIAVSKLANGTANQVIVTDGTNVSWSDNLTLAGDLTVNGTTTTINTQDLLVEDKNIIIGNVDTPTDVTADGGGITLKGATDKTINWVDSTDAWTSSERFSIPLGSAASPSLTFTGDENTGIYSPGADQVAISTNGTGRLFVDASGNVGINKTPGVTLDVQSTGSNCTLALNRTDAATAGQIQIAAGNNANSVLSTGTKDLFFSTNTLERLRITSDGKLGLGTSAPGELLHLSGGNLRIQDDTPEIRFRSPDGTNQYYIGANITNSVDGGIIIGEGAGITGGTPRLAINGSGTTTLTSASSTAPLIVNISTSEAARIDSSGRLLVGASASITAVTFPSLVQSNAFYAYQASLFSADANGPNTFFLKSRNATTGSHTVVQANDVFGQLNFAGSDGTNFLAGAAISAAVDGTPGTNDMPGRLVFSTTADGASSPTERMRIGANGSFRIGQTTTDTPGLSNTTVGIGMEPANGAIFLSRGDGSSLFVNRNSDGASTGFYRSGTLVGTISVTTTATAYNTSSDYRLKENIVPLTGAADRVNQLQVHRFNFIADASKTVDGFLAHEAQAVVPECVTGTKDEVDDDGNPVYQGIDQSKLVPLLTAALQEALAEIESLKARVTALEP